MKFAEYAYREEKDRWLRQERGIGFEEIIALIDEGEKIKVIDHYNQAAYPGQKIYVVEIDDYIWLVPFEIHGDIAYLQAAFRNRKFNKLMKEKRDEKEER